VFENDTKTVGCSQTVVPSNVYTLVLVCV